MKKYSCFDVIFDNQLAHIILNRPEKRNSMTTDFWKEFPEIVSDIDQEGIIYNQDGVVLRHAPDFVTACESTKNYIKNVRSKNYTDKPYQMGRSRIFTVV